MRKVWFDEAWEDYLYWQTQEKKTLKRINLILQDIDRNGYSGIGNPEPLKGELSGFWSRRIDGMNRLVYRLLYVKNPKRSSLLAAVNRRV